MMLRIYIIKIALGRAMWNIVDVAVAILLLALAFNDKKKGMDK